MFKLKISAISIFLLLVLFLSIAPASAATDISFSLENQEVLEGDIFDVVVTLDPKGEINFTVLLELKYPSDLLEAIAFKFKDEWTPIIQSTYDFIDNEAGIITKTAGVPGGFSEKRVFGVISFKARKEGLAVVNVGKNSLALNRKNKNTFNEFLPEAKINIKGERGEGGIPDKLLDISFDVEDYSIENVNDLLSKVSFYNFGESSTSVDLTFVIRDEKGKEIYMGKENVTVHTGEVLNKKFEDLDLSPGKYTIDLETVYDSDVSDKFTQDFKVVPEKKFFQERKFLETMLFVLLLLLIIIFIIDIRIKVKKKRDGK